MTNQRSPLEMVREFVEAKHASHDPKMWINLIIEEATELQDAWDAGNDLATLDGLCDLQYVLNGYALSRGWDLDSAYAEVHRSNMTKSSADKRADGKILKGSDYDPPHLDQFLTEQTMK